jgi:hypothetical protein
MTKCQIVRTRKVSHLKTMSLPMAHRNLCRTSLATLALAAALPGCRHVQWPRWFSPPGTANSQQLRASYEDPYTDTFAGPEVVGGRPREFQKQFAEPERSNPYEVP